VSRSISGKFWCMMCLDFFRNVLLLTICVNLCQLHAGRRGASYSGLPNAMIITILKSSQLCKRT
jgi:hypothetical protein